MQYLIINDCPGAGNFVITTNEVMQLHSRHVPTYLWQNKSAATTTTTVSITNTTTISQKTDNDNNIEKLLLNANY